MMKWLATAAAVLGLSAVTAPAHAVTQCEVYIYNIWAGDGGNIYFSYTNGGSTFLIPSNPDREAVLALVTTALVASRRVVVRYAADNVDCTSQNRGDFMGLYLF